MAKYRGSAVSMGGSGRTLVLEGAVRAALGSALPVAVLWGLLAGAMPVAGQAARPAAAPAATQPMPSVLVVPTDPLDGRPVAKVEVVGNVRTDSRLILDQARVTAGQAYHRSNVDIDVRSIAALELFSTVRAEVVPTADDRVVVRYIVAERPVITSVEFIGNQKKTDEQVKEVIQARAGGSVDPFVMQQDVRAIEEVYHKDGYNFASVSVDPKALKEHNIIRYVIVEGPRSRIWSVQFEGNEHIKTALLKWKIKTKSYIWIFRKGILNEDDLEADAVTVRETYKNKGYLDVRVSRSITYNEDKTRATVHFIIDEGPRYRVGKVNVEGNKVFGTDAILGDIILRPGDFVDGEKLEASQRHIEDRYGHEGYISRTVDLSTAYTGQEGVVDLNCKIVEDKAYSVGRVIVRGNGNTQDRVIRRQIRVYPEQTYDTVLVKKSVDRLKATRLFGDVKVTPVRSEREDVRDALVEVQEGQTGRFLIGAGISTNSGVIGQVSLEQQNFDWSNYPRSFGEFFRGQAFKGAGQYFRILLEPGTELQRYRVTFEEPYMFDTPYSFGNDAYYFTRSRESWDESRLGDIVTFGRRFGDVWSVTLGFRAEQVWITNPLDHGIPHIHDEPPAQDSVTLTPLYDSPQQVLNAVGGSFLTSIKPGVARDTTDSRIFPTTGTRAYAALEQYGAFGGDINMTKVTTGFNWYYPLYTDLFDRKTVLSNRNDLGLITNGDSVFFERFYGGGIGSLRGFRFRGVSPRGPAKGLPNQLPPLPQDNAVSQVANELKDPLGGDFSWLSSVEVNFPIYEDIVRGVVFVDVGTVESSVEIRTIRSDVGVGLRLTIPFFGQLPLALDFALPTSQSTQENDRTQIVSFSLGIPF